jgi:trehalose 6-phosphate synthase
MVRSLRPDAGIGFFMHIPVPPLEVFRRLPQREEVLRGLLGADLIGFQRPDCAENFRQLAQRVLHLPVRGEAISAGGRWVRTGGFPASVDAAGIEAFARRAGVSAYATQIRAELGNPRTVILAVDRLDYTKGIEERLAALGELFDEGVLRAPEVCVVQIIAPSREGIDTYQDLRARIEAEVSRINQAHPGGVRYVDRAVDRARVVAYYLAADVLAVTPLRDGMNLVAKEYVAARYDCRGALVLSEFAGAAAELRTAYRVNPYDRPALKSALRDAVQAPPEEAAARMRTMRDVLRQHDVWDWATTFFAALEEARALPAQL